MNLQVLVSTMNQENINLIKKMKINSNAVVINQCEIDSIHKYDINGSFVKWINSKSRGLSRSRNLALKYATEEICLFSDDDEEFVPNYENIILEQFNKYPDADIITFQVEGIESNFKTYPSYPKVINYITSMKISSVEIAFRLKSIREANIQFNEAFGAGSNKYLMGEENIFLFEALKKGLKIVYVPVKIANLHIGESTWFRGYNKDYFVSRGAAFTAMSKKLSLLLIIQFAIRKYKLYNEQTSIIEAIKYMLQGRQEYIKTLKVKGQ